MAGGKRGIEAGKAYIKGYWDDSAIVRGMKRIKANLNTVAKAMAGMGSAMIGVAGGMATAIGAATKVFASFDDQMRTVKAVSGSTEAEFQSLTETAKRLGATTSFTASEVAGLMAELGRAGFAASQIEAMTGAVLDMARATGTDATLSSGIMAATIRQFGLEASDATRVADAFTVAANKSFNSVESLGEAMAYAGPVAADLGMSLEETLAVFGTLGNVGIQGSNAGTAIRRLSTLTAAEAEKFQEIFGVMTADAAGNARPLIDVLTDINDATKDLGSADRAAKFNEAFGLLGITAASALGKAGDSTRELLDAIQNSGGAAREAAVEMDAGIGGSFRKMWSAIEGVAIGLGETLAPAIAKAADWVTQFAGRVLDAIKGNQTLVVVISAIVPILGGLGGVLVAAAAAIVGVTSTLSALAAVAGYLSVPVLAVVAGATALYAALGYLAYQSGLLGQVWEILKESGKNLFADAMESLKAFFAALQGGSMGTAFEALWIGFKLGFIEVVESLIKLWHAAIDSMAKYAVDRLKRAATFGLLDSSESGGGLGAMLGSLGLGDSREEMRARLKEIQQEFASPEAAQQQSPGQAPATITPGAGFDDPTLSAEDAAQQVEQRAEMIRKWDNQIAKSQMAREDQRQKIAGEWASPDRQAEMMGRWDEELAAAREKAEQDAADAATPPDPGFKGMQANASNQAVFATSSQGADVIGKALGMGMGVTDGDKLLAGKLDQVNKSIKNTTTIGTKKVG